MKKLIQNIKSHKIISTVIVVCLICFIGVGTAFGLHQAKIANTQKALLMAKDGYIDSDELNQLGEDIVEGEEIVMDDGTVVVVSKDKNGNYVTNSYESGGNTPTPFSHTHTWVAHTTNITHPAITERVMISPGGICCNTCGHISTSSSESQEHVHATGHGGTHSVSAQYETQIIQPAWTEQIVDYYYCSECGAIQ